MQRFSSLRRTDDDAVIDDKIRIDRNPRGGKGVPTLGGTLLYSPTRSFGLMVAAQLLCALWQCQWDAMWVRHPDLCPLCQCQCQVSGMWIQCPVTRPRKIRCICADNVSAIFTDTNTLQGWVVSSVISSYRKPYRRTNSSYTSSHNHTRLVHARSCIRNIHGLSSAEANPAMLQLQHAGTPASQSSLRWQQQRFLQSMRMCEPPK